MYSIQLYNGYNPGLIGIFLTPPSRLSVNNGCGGGDRVSRTSHHTGAIRISGVRGAKVILHLNIVPAELTSSSTFGARSISCRVPYLRFCTLPSAPMATCRNAMWNAAATERREHGRVIMRSSDIYSISSRLPDTHQGEDHILIHHRHGRYQSSWSRSG